MYSPNNYVNCKDFSHKGINIGYVEINLNEVYKKPLDKAYIIGMGDFHADSFAFNEGKLINFFNWCKETNTRVLITGDILEMAVVDSVSFTYGQSTPWQDLSKATDILYRYKDLIDGVVSGNHDERIQKRSGIDVLREFCKYNGIPYHANGLVVVYKLGVHKGTKNTFSYTVFVTHTRRGGRTPGSQVNKLVDLSNVIDADIFLAGHTHDLTVRKQAYFSIDSRHHRIVKKTQVFANCGSFHEYVGYPAQKNLPPTKTGAVRIRLDGTKKDVHMSI